MVSSKNNLKGYLNRAYPDIKTESVNGVNAYIIDKSLSQTDAYLYQQHQLKDGRYIIFVNMTPEQVVAYLTTGVRSSIRKVPTSYSAMELWCLRNHINYLEKKRVYGNPQKLLNPIGSADIIIKNDNHQVRYWYIYQFRAEVLDNIEIECPHTTTGDIVSLLTTCPANKYTSKTDLLTQKLSVMQPIYDKIVESIATNADDVTILQYCSSYGSIQFDEDVYYSDIKAIKEAHSKGLLRDYLRIRQNAEISNIPFAKPSEEDF